MGLVKWLFGSSESIAPVELESFGTFSVAIVGEASYQGSLERICGPRCIDGENRLVKAQLILDDRNRYDLNAVRVEIGGRVVGYLPRDYAKKFRSDVRAEGAAATVFRCEAQIRGGWDRGGGDVGHYGVWLDIATPGLKNRRMLKELANPSSGSSSA